MTQLPRWYRRWFALYPASFRADAERELCEMAAAEWARAGSAPARALVALRLAFDHLITMSGAWLGRLAGRRGGAGLGDGLRRDLRYAWRGLVRTPVFFVVAVLVIAIGVGATTAILSVGNGILLRPPPGVRNAAELITVHERARDGSSFHSFSFADFGDLAAGTPAGVTLASYNTFPATLSEGGEPVVSFGLGVSGGYFEILGTRPLLGRLLGPADDAGAGGPRVVVLSHSFWRDRMASDSSVIGRTVTLNGESFAIVGVAEPRFRGHIAGFDVGLWVPVSLSLSPSRRSVIADRRSNWLEIVGRASGVERRVVEDRLSSISAATGREMGFDWDRSVEVLAFSPVPGAAFLPILGFVGLLLVLGAMVLMISSTNVAGVMVARAAARTREIAVRLAIGAHRGQVIRQLLVENVLLFLIGGAGGVLLAWVAVRALAGADLPIPVPVVLDFPLDGRVLAVSLGVTLLSGLAFGLAPALRVSRPQLTSALRDDGAGAGPARVRLRTVLVVAQVAGSALLLVMAGLLGRALSRAGQIDLGFEPAGLRVAEFDFRILDYDSTRIRRFTADMTERLAASPGVESVAGIDLVPVSLANQTSVVALDGRERVEGVGFFGVDFAVVTPGYFATMGIPILRGRPFGEEDRGGAPRTIIINEVLAQQLWPGEEAVGRTLRWGQISGGPPATVIGVARTAAYRSIGEAPRAAVYLPIGQEVPTVMTFLIRERRPDPALATTIRSVAADFDPNLPIVTNTTYESIIGLSLLPNRVAAFLASAFGAVGLILATVGLYGVLSYLVLRRRRELGIRLALGAGAGSLRRMVLADGMRLTGMGLLIGVGLSVVLAQGVRSLFFGVAALDVVSMVGATVVMLVVAALAADVPARRAAATAPAEVLRDE